MGMISIVGMNYLYLLIVVFIVMIKVFMKHTNDVITPKNHTQPQWSSLQWLKPLCCKHTYIQMLLDTDFH